MKLTISATSLLLLLLLPGCQEKNGSAAEEPPDTLVSDYDDSEMGQAMAKARETVDEFLSVLASGDADNFSIKAPVTDANGTEHFWIVDVSYDDGVFSGTIGNDPGIVQSVSFGQAWTVKKEKISDWMYVRGERIHGGFTIDPLLDTYPEDEAKELREKLVR